MLFHADGSRLLTHFIRPCHVLTLLRNRAFCLVRVDQQKSDPSDSKLPQACFDQPHHGPLEHGLGLTDEFLKSQAAAIEASRDRTYIMCWTHNPTRHMKAVYGENGGRCTIELSEIQLKILLGYGWASGAEFPPARRPMLGVPHAYLSVQLIEPLYTDSTSAVSVVPSYFASSHKDEQFAGEAELRVQGIVGPPEKDVSGLGHFLPWELPHFNGLAIGIGAKVPESEAAEIQQLAGQLSLPVRRLSASP
jgi:hypothetical protein